MELSSQLSSTSTDISTLFGLMGDFEERLNKATSTAPAGTADLPTLARDFMEFKTLVWKVLSKLKLQTELLSLGQDRHETFMRRKTLLFHGIAESKEEKIQERVHKILTDQMQLSDLTLTDLQSCHRLGSSTTKARPVLVRFRDLEHRRLVWDTKTSLKDTGIVISEFLTKSRHEVFMAARSHFSVKNCWSEGKIIILLPDGSRKRIEVLSELKSLIAAFPQAKVAKQDPPKKTKDSSSKTNPGSDAAGVGGRNLRVRK
ncbi:hypothetical protein NE865_00594 [Phthorimaea operculella]|nr:hypothetical protein NE865_00594 [Phthorimaea operculella]